MTVNTTVIQKKLNEDGTVSIVFKFDNIGTISETEKASGSVKITVDSVNDTYSIGDTSTLTL